MTKEIKGRLTLTKKEKKELNLAINLRIINIQNSDIMSKEDYTFFENLKNKLNIL